MGRPKSDEYTPNGQSLLILERAWEHVQSVTYNVSLRWLFYRLLQDGFYKGKADYHIMAQLFIKVRKKFWGPWKPNLLADETREMIQYVAGDESETYFFESLINNGVSCNLDHWYHQESFICLMYEAKAMTGQFRQYAPGITLIPFGGNPSLDYKWTIAKYFEHLSYKYNIPLLVYYFGDCDEAGELILKAALKDIEEWCDVEFEITHVGLTREQAEAFKVPENVDKPGEYQWEALTDEQASSLIKPITDLVDANIKFSVSRKERRAEQRVLEVACLRALQGTIHGKMVDF